MPRPSKKTDQSKAPRKNGGSREKTREATGFSEIWVAGYKSIVDEQRIEIRPLTILAGANSSGKSSIIQPLLLLKQTLEAAYDPGALLLNGPNVKSTSASQLLSRSGSSAVNDQINVGIAVDGKLSVELSFRRVKEKGFDIKQVKYDEIDGSGYLLFPGMSHDEVMSKISQGFLQDVIKVSDFRWRVVRKRCFLEPQLGRKSSFEYDSFDERALRMSSYFFSPFSAAFESKISKVIHVPGIRGNPERTYPVTAVGSTFPGLFQNYVASVIAHWQSTGTPNKLAGLEDDLKSLGLTWKISAKSIDDTQVELRIGRLSQQEGRSDDVVNIADVGLAVSQVLPVLVALRAASPGQLVFIEQPELHLHPSAQIQLAGILANAAKAGVQVLVETHSSLLLLAIQTLIAEDKLSQQDVKLHWFTRDEQGATRVTSANLDERGAFGDWPEDFGTISLEAEHRYLTASEKKLQ